MISTLLLKLSSSTNTFGGYARLKSLAKDSGGFTGSLDRLALLATTIACETSVILVVAFMECLIR